MSEASSHLHDCRRKKVYDRNGRNGKESGEQTFFVPDRTVPVG